MRNFTIVGIFILTSLLNIEAKSQSSGWLTDYNVIWHSQSENSSASMPVGGGDIGMNVWVENNELLFYIQRSGVHDEYNGFPKLGRVRIWTEPNIFDGANSFKQELVLGESCILVSANHPQYGKVKFKIWAEVHRPKVHVECESNKAITYYSQYESWRTMPRKLSDGSVNESERWGWWDTGGWAHEVVLEPDNFRQENNAFTFWHINPEEKLTSKLAYKLIGMEDDYGKFYDPLKDAVWGGQMYGNHLIFDKKTEGKYIDTEYSGWRFKSASPCNKHEISLWLHNRNTFNFP